MNIVSAIQATPYTATIATQPAWNTEPFEIMEARTPQNMTIRAPAVSMHI